MFVLFGAGEEGILFAAHIGFVGALVLGLTQLLLADHDGSLDRRDYLGLLAGFAGVMCSGVAVSMTNVVGLAMLSVAADAFMRRSRVGILAVALLLVGVPGNFGLLVDYDTCARFMLGQPDLVLALPRVPSRRGCDAGYDRSQTVLPKSRSGGCSI